MQVPRQEVPLSPEQTAGITGSVVAQEQEHSRARGI